jgi:hypothetical protein
LILNWRSAKIYGINLISIGERLRQEFLKFDRSSSEVSDLLSATMRVNEIVAFQVN